MIEDDEVKFSQQLAHLSKGTIDNELTETLRDLVKAINDHQRGGKITLTLSLKPKVKQGEVMYVEIQPEIKTEMPKVDRLASFMFPTTDGQLLRDDPDQGELNLRRVTPDEKPTRKVSE